MVRETRGVILFLAGMAYASAWWAAATFPVQWVGMPDEATLDWMPLWWLAALLTIPVFCVVGGYLGSLFCYNDR
jgi:hypothetical protein